MTTKTPGVIVTDLLPSVKDQPLFAADIIEGACELIRGTIIGQAVNPKSAVIQIERMIYTAFMRQAQYRNTDIHSLQDLVNMIGIEVREPTPLDIIIHIPEGVLEQLDAHLYNRICHICGCKVPGGSCHEKWQCDEQLVEGVMAE
jgi:hypothetical protein